MASAGVPNEDLGAPRPESWTASAKAIVALCFAINMVDGMDLLIVSFLAPTLQAEWSVDSATFALVFSVGLAGMAFGGLVLAPLADRFGRRRLIVTALVAMSASMVVSSFTRSVAELATVRFFVGTGIGTILACIPAISARAAPDRYRNFAVGVLQAGYPIGAMITGFATAWALPHFGWHACLRFIAGITILFVPLALAILPRDERVTAKGPRISLAETIAGPRRRSTFLLWATTISGFMALYFIVSWITKLAIEAGLPETQAIVASAVYNFGGFAGTVALSILGVRLDVRKLCATLLILAAAVFLWFGGVPMSLAGVLFAAFVMGVTLQGGYNMVYPIAANVYPDAVRSTGIGWAFGIGRIGAFTGPLVGGYALAAKLPLVMVFGIFCVPLLIAALCARTIRFEDEAAVAAPAH